MFVPYSEMPSSSRLWIYPADRDLSADEVSWCSEQLQGFCETWAAHGQGLQCSWAIHRNRFILLAANEAATGASGCSIDSSTRFIQQLGARTGIDFFDRRPAFLIGECVEMISMNQLSEAFAGGKLSGDSPVFHLQAATLGEWNTTSVLPAADTWLRRYIRPTVSDIPR